MSSYAYLYVVNGDKATTLYTASRSSRFYQMLNDGGAPYAKVSRLTLEKVTDIIDRLEADTESYQGMVENDKETIATIASMPDPIETKLEKIEEYRNYMAEAKDELDNVKYWHTIFGFIRNMISEVEDNKKYNGVSDDVWFGIGIDSCTAPDPESFIIPTTKTAVEDTDEG